MRHLLFILTFVFLSVFASSQGLEDIIVEKYYVSDANDASATAGGTLPAGSITYRIYVDMATGYKLRSVFCDYDNAHDLRIATTTYFFNNVFAGETTSNAIANADLNQNTVMLDSWISLGGTSASNLGVLKSEDTNGAILNAGGFLQNEDSRAGTPVRIKDGMIPGTPAAISKIGLDQALSVFDAVNAGPVFYATDGTWFNPNGVVGPTADNRVLIAQITTNGTLSYSLNLLLIRISDLKPERYVHSYAVDNEILCEKCLSLGVPTSIAELNRSVADNSGSPFSDFRLFPNPARNILNIEFSYELQNHVSRIVVMNILGESLLGLDGISQSGKYIKDIDISSLPVGLYIVSIISDNGVKSSRRFIKNH